MSEQEELKSIMTAYFVVEGEYFRNAVGVKNISSSEARSNKHLCSGKETEYYVEVDSWRITRELGIDSDFKKWPYNEAVKDFAVLLRKKNFVVEKYEKATATWREIGCMNSSSSLGSSQDRFYFKVTLPKTVETYNSLKDLFLEVAQKSITERQEQLKHNAEWGFGEQGDDVFRTLSAHTVSLYKETL
jgi:hypothetical protein